LYRKYGDNYKNMYSFAYADRDTNIDGNADMYCDRNSDAYDNPVCYADRDADSYICRHPGMHHNADVTADVYNDRDRNADRDTNRNSDRNSECDADNYGIPDGNGKPDIDCDEHSHAYNNSDGHACYVIYHRAVAPGLRRRRPDPCTVHGTDADMVVWAGFDRELRYRKQDNRKFDIYKHLYYPGYADFILELGRHGKRVRGGASFLL
jgi:hypothetical protein